MAHLLIVEDDLLVQRALMRALHDHVCVAACNGLEALALLKEHTFDLVISDVDMPVMNGVDFYRKARELFPTLKIVFRTGSKVPDLSCLGAPVVPKDTSMVTILDLIEACVGVPVLRAQCASG